MLSKEAGLRRLKIYELLNAYFYDLTIQARLNETAACTVRLYMIEGFNFAKRDLFSESDPYLKISCGRDITFNERENY